MRDRGGLRTSEGALFDSHCHLTDDAFAADLPDVLQRAHAAGVTAVTTIASNAADAENAIALAAVHASVWCTVGIHPHDADSAVRDFPRIRELAGSPGVVALGETGLDYHYDHSARDAQRAAFTQHLALAAETGRPVVVHSREAEADTLAALAGSGVRGVLHCFSGNEAMLEAALAAGWYISFGGMVTFRNWQGSALLRRVPVERLLLETDGPYLAPVPYRGKRNEPAYLPLTCVAAAGLRGEDAVELGRLTDRNARTFFGID